MATKTINGTPNADSITIQDAVPTPGLTVLFNSVLTGPFIDEALIVNGGNGSDSIDLFGLKNSSGVKQITIDGGNGNDHIRGSKVADTILGGQGRDSIIGASGSDFLKGGDDYDYIYGNCGNDSIFGEAGNDLLFGYGDNDLLYGGTENDILHGDPGNDSLYGEAGDDLLYGDEGSDLLDGGEGNDTVTYINSPEAVQVNLETNSLTGGYASEDVLMIGSIENVIGTAFNDLIVGNSIDNLLVGGQRKDSLMGRGGNDTLRGDIGQDLLNGDEGNDILIGGAGKDLLAGGAGFDTFTFVTLKDSRYVAHDVISDYEMGDILDAPNSVLSTSLTTSIGQAASLSRQDILGLLTLGTFAPNAAVAFTVADQSGTFIALNDGQAGFSPRTDSIIQLHGFNLGSSEISIV